MKTWKCTHKITEWEDDGEQAGKQKITYVMLDESVDGNGGPAYTRLEWTSLWSAEWEVTNGEWSFQGRPCSMSGSHVEIEIEKIPNVRQYVQFTIDQASQLQRIAKKENRSVAFLVRKAVNTWLTDRANAEMEAQANAES